MPQPGEWGGGWHILPNVVEPSVSPLRHLLGRDLEGARTFWPAPLRTPGPEGARDFLLVRAQQLGLASGMLTDGLHGGDMHPHLLPVREPRLLSPFCPLEEGAELRPGTRNFRAGVRFSQSISCCCLLLCPGTWAPSRPLSLLQGHGERPAPLAAFLRFSSQQEEATNPRTSQKMSLWLPEPSPRAHLTWDLEASVSCSDSLSKAQYPVAIMAWAM